MEYTPLFSSWSEELEEASSSSSCVNQSLQCLPQASVAFTIISSVASIVGSLFIICTFLRWKDLRTIARMILVFLAIADLFTGIGYLFGAGIYINFFYLSGYCSHSRNESWMPPSNQTSYERLCTAQSFFTTLMPMASFLWTANLAIYLLISVAWPRPKVVLTKVIMIVFHVTAWGIPLVTCVAAVAKGMLGSSGSRSSGGWCWIKWNEEHPSIYFVMELMAGKVWEMIVCVLALVICVAIKVIVWRRFRSPKVSWMAT